MKDKLKQILSPRALLLPSLIALGLNLVIEILARRSLLAALGSIITNPLLFLLSALIIDITLIAAQLLPHRYFALTLVGTVWLGLGIANCVLMIIRNSPLCGVDFYIITTGISIITAYLNLFQMILAIGAILLAIGGLVVLYLKLPKRPVPFLTGLSHLACTVIVLSISLLGVKAAGAVPDQFDSMTAAYDRFGFAYCFTQSIFDRGIDMPDGYSEESIRSIVSLLEAKGGKTDSDRPLPNLIVLQLESFFDVTAVRDISFSRDPIPVFRALKQNGPHGFLTVPSVGGGTANTEFEVITGMSLDFFGIGEYPYNTVLRQMATPSYPYLLSGLGYRSQVFHNHEGSFYDRHRVYPNLGFERFVSIEYMNGYERNEIDWCTDAILTDQLISAMKATEEQDLLFAVSVQCHGKYPTQFIPEAGQITVSGIDDPVLASQYAYYANQLYQVDLFLSELMAALSTYEEPTTLLIYGDHLPSLALNEADLPEGQTLYQTEYAIWSNDQALPARRVDLGCSQVVAEMLDLCGIHEGAITRLHQSMRGEDCYDTWLHALQYDAIYGKAVSTGGFFKPTELKMGLTPITVTDAYNAEEGLYVVGKGFTAHSVVSIDGWRTQTEFLSDELLLCRNALAHENDRIVVCQVSGSGTELSKTETYIATELNKAKQIEGEAP